MVKPFHLHISGRALAIRAESLDLPLEFKPSTSFKPL